MRAFSAVAASDARGRKSNAFFSSRRGVAGHLLGDSSSNHVAAKSLRDSNADAKNIQRKQKRRRFATDVISKISPHLDGRIKIRNTRLERDPKVIITHRKKNFSHFLAIRAMKLALDFHPEKQSLSQ
ncbi:hypothetical protein [Xanthomonas sp. GW]|uniref:hypothetical protein n=1 Tax=Xanthomonas sp. GW TaxID=2724121 RepID=UPI00163A2C32|nr:hypothetical protein [Xanthomonas sp. GW]